MIACSGGGTTVTYDETTHAVTISRNGHDWHSLPGAAALDLADPGTGRTAAVPFGAAADIVCARRDTGTGEGIAVRYSGFAGADAAFETLIRIEAATGDVIAEWIPLRDDAASIAGVRWPAPMAFDRPSDDWATLITHGQGVLIPNTWPERPDDIPFDGRYGTEGGYMPFFAQLRRDLVDGYIAICETPWNAGYAVDHPAGGPYTHIGTWFEPSLGRMDYRRVVRYRFLEGEDATVTGVAKAYRRHAAEHGLLRTLAEKAARNPSVRDLPGCMWVHVGAKSHTQPDSSIYDKEHPERNDSLVTFDQRARQLRMLHDAGVERLYLHLDGWGQPGYDNRHPDYLPACREAGGWEGLRALADTAHECGYLFGLHDQYRDYYFTAASHDDRNAVMLPDGTRPEHARWAGGRQQYLCARLAPGYVTRNYTEIAAHGVDLDGTYLDVFTCNEGDECADPAHRMTRRECYGERLRCFEWLLSHGILTSSEEVADWAMPSLVFCHYAPYEFQLRGPDKPREGVPVPLQNLVYHDCVVEPWMMDRIDGGEDYMLYALLNGGAPYLIRETAYAGVDGDLADARHRSAMAEDIARCRVVAELHRRVGMSEMTGFAFIDGDPRRQRTTFADGTRVSVDLDRGAYMIEYPDRTVEGTGDKEDMR